MQMTNNHEKNLTNSQEQTVTLQDSKAFFVTLLHQIQQTNWRTSLIECTKKYSLQSYKLTQLTPKNVQMLYERMISKYKMDGILRMTWFQNQLRLYIWILAASPRIFGLPLTSYGQQQLNQLSKPFFGISKELCQYQFRIVTNSHFIKSWQFQQNQLLSEIIKKHLSKGCWSTIAKQLFLISQKRFFRTPQVCRQRWKNHLDDRKIRGQWTIQEDYLLMKYIIQDGKRWAVIARKIGQARTQHMVKNRYQTILRRQFKSTKKPNKFSEQIKFCKKMKNQLLENIVQKPTIDTFDSDLLKPLIQQKSTNLIKSINSKKNDSMTFKQLDTSVRLSNYQSQSTQNLSYKRLKLMDVEFQNDKTYQDQYFWEGAQCCSQNWLSKLNNRYRCSGLDLEIPLFLQQQIFVNRNSYDLTDFLIEQKLPY